MIQQLHNAGEVSLSGFADDHEAVELGNGRLTVSKPLLCSKCRMGVIKTDHEVWYQTHLARFGFHKWIISVWIDVLWAKFVSFIA